MSLADLHFDNPFISTLAGDPETANRPRAVSEVFFSRVQPKPFKNPSLLAVSPEALELIDLSLEDSKTDAFLDAFSGRKPMPGMDPYALCYGGHQFGNWAGQLGDGRAINLGELVNKQGQRWALQLKGSGPTPYSRRGDGFAVLRSSVREFLCSEAMHHLGVPTTRALSLVLTGEEVLRDMFYDGHPEMEPGAVVCRMSPTFTRFGSFEIFAMRRQLEPLRQLVEYSMRQDFGHKGQIDDFAIMDWYREVGRRTVDMIVHWLRVGFVHGVMNTDNMSILGLTIDYGPYGWLEDYDPTWTPNTTDAHSRRYRYGNQPAIALWNLRKFANCLELLLSDGKKLADIHSAIRLSMGEKISDMLASKLGLKDFKAVHDADLLIELERVLQITETDMTLFYRGLADCDPSQDPSSSDEALIKPLMPAFYKPDELNDEKRYLIADWLRHYFKRLNEHSDSHDDRRARMNAVNPKYVLRNFMAQEAIDLAEKGDSGRIETLLDVLRHPYDDQPEYAEFAVKRPEWARHRPGCSMLSCSS